ncbi:MAG: glucose 1-dehydrogenase [Planctomycetota bacterium]|nr:glucose 1-dehydrogenase [Planctomycetota bacterium]
MDFTGKAVLVTGAGAGIGRAAAVLFGKAGAKVAINTLDTGRGEKTLDLVKRAGAPQAVFIQGDVSLKADAERMISAAVEAFGKLDVLINNAGIVIPGTALDTTEADLERTLAVNVKGLFILSQLAIRQMLRQGGGVIVNNGSSAALKGVANRAAYSASKGAVLALTRAMAADHRRDNIRINCVCPGTTLTPSLEARISALPDPKAAMAEFENRQPIGRLGTPEEIAGAMLFAAWDGNSFMNGAIISVDGGMTAC